MSLQEGLVGHWTMDDRSIPDNQTVNPSFEEDSLGTDTPTGWVDNSGNWIVTDEKSHSGTFSFGNYWDGDASGGDGSSAGVYADGTYAYQEYTNVQPGEKYLASAYLYSPSGSGNGDGDGGQTQYIWEDDGRIRVTAYDSSDTQIARYETMWMGETTDLNDHEWNKRELEFTIPQNTEYIHLNIDGGDNNNSEGDKDSADGGNAGLFIDDVLLRKQRVYDRSAYDNHGEFVSGVEQNTSGFVSTSIDFDADQYNPDYISLSSPLSYAENNEVTIALWINKDSGDAGWDPQPSRRGIFEDDVIEFDQKRNNNVFISIGSAGLGDVNDGTYEYPDDEWNLLAVRYDGSTAEMIRNTSVIDTASLSSLSTPTSNGYIGANRNDTGRSWGGDVDDMRVYSRALSDGEINQLYQMRSQQVRQA